MEGSVKIRAGVIGGAGYTGGEMIRILINHPQVELAYVHSKSNAGNPLYRVHTDLLGDTEMTFTGAIGGDIDVMFLCL
ncbi:MAG TPA: N-acetyl-gamma-glutamyl-phosphate reductase, partial [Sphingobacteriaceae bacterium]